MAVEHELDIEPLTSSLGYQLRRLQLGFRKHFLRVAGPDGVQPNQVGAMYMIGLNPGISPSQLGAVLGMDAAQVTTMLNTLELRGFVTRQTAAHDGRARTVHLTPSGEAEFAKIREIATEAERTFTAGALTSEEAIQLSGFLSRLLAAMPD